jgi:hypothetical protein
MHKRPREFALLATALFLIAGAMPAQVALMFGHPPWEVLAILAKLAPMNWVVLALAITGALISLRAARALIGFVPLFVVAVAWNHWIIARSGLNHGPAALILSTMGVAALMSLLLFPEPLRVLRKPGLRWWQTAPRVKAQLPTVIWPVLGGEVVAETFDLSEGGAFIAWQASSTDVRSVVMLRNLRSGTHCSVRVVLGGERTLRCTAQVVRQAPAQGKYPEGFALRFIGLTHSERRMLARYVKTSVSSQPGTLAQAA